MEQKHFRLPKDFTEIWLQALEGGEYQQGRGSLRDSRNDTYCCLGVACHISYGENYPYEDHVFITANFYDDDEGKFIPEELKGDDLDLCRILAGLNDGTHDDYIYKMMKIYPNLIFSKIPEEDGSKVKYSFKEIAQWIRLNVELY